MNIHFPRLSTAARSSKSQTLSQRIPLASHSAVPESYQKHCSRHSQSQKSRLLFCRTSKYEVLRAVVPIKAAQSKSSCMSFCWM